MASYINNLIPQMTQAQNPAASAGTQSVLPSLTQGTGGNQSPEEKSLSFMELLYGKLQESGKPQKAKTDGANGVDSETVQMLSLLAAQLITAPQAQNASTGNQTQAPAQEAALTAVTAGGIDMDVNGQSQVPDLSAMAEEIAGQTQEEAQPRPFDTQQTQSPLPPQAEAARTAAPTAAAETVLPAETAQAGAASAAQADARTFRQEVVSSARTEGGEGTVPNPIAGTPSLRQAELSRQSGDSQNGDAGDTGGGLPQQKAGQPVITGQPEAGAAQAAQAAVQEPFVFAEAAEPLTEPAQLMDRLVRSVTLAGSGGESSIELSLEPAFLGKLSVRLTSGADGGVTARLISADPAVRGLLSSNVEQLRTSLLENGINLQGIDISGGAAQQRQTTDSRGGAYDRRREGKGGIASISGASAASYGQDFTAEAAASQRTNLYGTVEFSA